MSKLQANNHGFTLVELLIATTIFSTILLLCTFGLLQIGRIYYKGITSIRTQSVARDVVDSVSQSIQYGGNAPSTYVTAGSTSGSVCIGNVLYEYNKDTMVSGTDYALKRSEDCNLKKSSREMLAKNMRLSKFTIQPKGSGYEVSVKVTAGDSDLLDSNGNCLGVSGRQFCATSELTTTVQRKL